jgi:hypothetical protein
MKASYPINPEVLKLMPNVRRATFREAIYNIMRGKLLWWLVDNNK